MVVLLSNTMLLWKTGNIFIATMWNRAGLGRFLFKLVFRFSQQYRKCLVVVWLKLQLLPPCFLLACKQVLSICYFLTQASWDLLFSNETSWILYAHLTRLFFLLYVFSTEVVHRVQLNNRLKGSTVGRWKALGHFLFTERRKAFTLS